MRRSLRRSGKLALRVDRCPCRHRSSRGWVLRHRRRIRHTRRRIDSWCRAGRTVRIAQRPEPGKLRGRAPTTPPPHRPQGASAPIDERCPSYPAALSRRPPLSALRRILIRVGGGTSPVCCDSSTWGSCPQEREGPREFGQMGRWTASGTQAYWRGRSRRRERLSAPQARKRRPERGRDPPPASRQLLHDRISAGQARGERDSNP